MSQPAAAKQALSLTGRPQWQALQQHAGQIERRHLRELFSGDPSRGERLVAEAAGLYLDYSKNRITGETIRLLVDLAEACDLRERIHAMFRSDPINATEQRAVLHVALCAPAGERILVDGKDVVPDGHAVLDRMAAFSERVRSGAWTGYSGKPVRNVIDALIRRYRRNR
jgi:glucose-6-phosphate isomerase